MAPGSPSSLEETGWGLGKESAGNWELWPPNPTSLPEVSCVPPTFQGWVLPRDNGMLSEILRGLTSCPQELTLAWQRDHPVISLMCLIREEALRSGSRRLLGP